MGETSLVPLVSPRALKPLPRDWDLIVSVDTGTFMSATFTAIPPGDIDPGACVIEEIPNYRYVSHEIELLGASNTEWARHVYRCWRYHRPEEEWCNCFVDPNTQFRAELLHYKLNLVGNTKGPELRVEIAREYMAADPQRLWLAPWLTVLPYEIEHAKWPDDTNSAGKFMRIKRHDHTLDTMEHSLSQRPRSKPVVDALPQSFLDSMLAMYGRLPEGFDDPHLGGL